MTHKNGVPRTRPELIGPPSRNGIEIDGRTSYKKQVRADIKRVNALAQELENLQPLKTVLDLALITSSSAVGKVSYLTKF
jgi:hypothetical protein